MSPQRRFIVTELFDPQDYEEYSNFLYAHKFETKPGCFLFPWSVEGGFAYYVHAKDVHKAMNNNVICLSLSSVETEPPVYEEEKKAETEEGLSGEEGRDEKEKVAEKVEGEEEEDLEPRTGLCRSFARMFEPVDKLVQDCVHAMTKNPILGESWDKGLQNTAGNFFSPSQLLAAWYKDEFRIKSSQYSAHNLFGILPERTDNSYCSTRYPFDPGIHYRSLFSNYSAMDTWVPNVTSEMNHATYFLVEQVVNELSRKNSTPLGVQCYPFDPGIHLERDMLVTISLYFKEISVFCWVRMASIDFRSALLHLFQYFERTSSYQTTNTMPQFYDLVVTMVFPNKLAFDDMDFLIAHVVVEQEFGYLLQLII